MKKINLLLSHTHRTCFNNYWIVNFLNNHFNVLFVEDDQIVEKHNTIIVYHPSNTDWVRKYHDQGFKLVAEHLWDSGNIAVLENSTILSNVNWFWYNESMCYKSRQLEKYKPAKNYTKLALMPLWNVKLHRDQLLDSLSDILDQLVYSYVERGINLPNDDETSTMRYNYFNPAWYDSTHFSIVAETWVDPPHFFISEKTYKPFAFYHPFVLLGQPGVLAHLRKEGFETFENLFDESYDTVDNFELRLFKIVSAIRNYIPHPYDKLTLDKLSHNHHQLFDTQLVDQRLVNEVVNPLLSLL